jgi:restriction endonuclease S subunit
MVPEYTKPDVLNVEVTNNGESYTNDNKTYGFFDPFVIDADPKLIAVDGSTLVSVKGIGFVNSGTTKAIFNNRTHPLICTD